MIAISLNHKQIKIKHPTLIVDFIDDRDTYIEISQLWMKSPWLPGDPPFGFDGIHRCIVMADGWELCETNVYGDIVRILL